jgi:hypothetical protein
VQFLDENGRDREPLLAEIIWVGLFESHICLHGQRDGKLIP